MKDLRVYMDPAGTVAPGTLGVFYTRRADGPYYLWLYEEGVERWRSKRVQPSKLTLRELSVASQQTVPTELQTRLFEHYLD
jgi:hypothetical protein